jgi:hypothetical protein
LKFQWSRFFQPVFGRRKSIDCSAELPPAVALSNSHYVARVNDAIPSAPPANSGAAHNRCHHRVGVGDLLTPAAFRIAA